MQVISAGNVGIRRRHVEAQDVYEVADYVLEFNSEPIPTKYCTSGVLNFQWADFNHTDALLSIEGSYDGTTWNVWEGSLTTLDSASDTQVYDFTKIGVYFIRVHIEFSTVTSGVFGFSFKGEFNSAKNY